MKIIRIIKIFTINAIIFTSFSSCNAQNNNPVEIGLKDCINEVVNKYAKESYGKTPFDFYSFMQEIEQQLIAHKLINNTKKESYLDLFSKIENEKKDTYENFYNKAISLMEDKGFDFNLYIINNAVFSKCPYDVLTKIEEYKNDPYYKYAVLLNRVMNHGYNNQEAIRELIELTNETEYTKPHYRAPIILLVVINIDLKFNPAEPMEKFEVGGKTYFRPKKKD